jgi:hypothetical protein
MSPIAKVGVLAAVPCVLFGGLRVDIVILELLIRGVSYAQDPFASIAHRYNTSSRVKLD